MHKSTITLAYCIFHVRLHTTLSIRSPCMFLYWEGQDSAMLFIATSKYERKVSRPLSDKALREYPHNLKRAVRKRLDPKVAHLQPPLYSFI